MQPKLPVHEWIAVWTILTLLLILTFITTIFNQNPIDAAVDSPHLLVAENLEIMIEGAVENPGSYHVKRGALVEEVLELAKPLPNADLRRVKKGAKVRDGQFIRIPTYQMITIHLEGAVNLPGSMQVRKGTKMIDLVTMLEWPEEADLRSLRKKRNLKDQEVINVPIL